jgi:aspartate racemase
VLSLKTIGLIGGMSWKSTIEYYEVINETVRSRLGGFHSAKCLMYTVDFAEIEILQRENKWKEVSDIMVDIANKLKKGGADFIVICTNTIHKVVSEIEKKVGIKVLHIVELTGKKIIQNGMKKVGLLGTKFTMEGDFYKNILKDRFNIDVIVPNEVEREFIHKVIFEELCKGIINKTSKEKYKEIIDSLVLIGAEGVILGCTEIPLLIKQEDVSIPVFDTTKIHAVSAVEFALEK